VEIRADYGNQGDCFMKLTIVIPAYNEEKAIAATIERTLAARSHIIEHAPVDGVEIIVVSDGSSDRTAEIASAYKPEIRLIEFERNRGYGAAIKRGFAEGSGDLMGFLDADGTCDPVFFAALCTAIIDQDAAVAIGSRMGPQSQMPRLRRIGNRLYAFLLSALSNRVVTDTASGMRVIRRDVWPRLDPLPDGLHFTPAMSARTLMDPKLAIVECPMTYEERIGESKLNVVKDGVRFLRTILEMTLVWRPAKLFMAVSALCFAWTLLLAMHPAEMWIRLRHLQEDMIYRLLTCLLLGTLGATFLAAGVMSDHVHRLLDRRKEPNTFAWRMLDQWFSLRGASLTGLIMTPLLLGLVGPGLWTWMTAGYVVVHWSRVVLAGLIVFSWVQLLVSTLIVNILRFHTTRAASSGSGRITATGEAQTRSLFRPAPTASPKM